MSSRVTEGLFDTSPTGDERFILDLEYPDATVFVFPSCVLVILCIM